MGHCNVSMRQSFLSTFLDGMLEFQDREVYLDACLSFVDGQIVIQYVGNNLSAFLKKILFLLFMLNL